MLYCSIDTETTGLIPGTHQIIEFGAVIADTSKPYQSNLPSFRALLGHENLIFQPESLAMHRELIEELTRLSSKDHPFLYYNHRQFVQDFAVFLRSNGFTARNDQDPRTQFVAAGKNFAHFDERFLEELPDWNDMLVIRHRTLDPMMLYLHPDDTEPPTLSRCVFRMNNPNWKEASPTTLLIQPNTITHRALDDAKLVAKLIQHKLCPV